MWTMEFVRIVLKTSIALVIALSSGCFRRSYDLCAAGFVHAECPRDAALESSSDAAIADVTRANADAQN